MIAAENTGRSSGFNRALVVPRETKWYITKSNAIIAGFNRALVVPRETGRTGVRAEPVILVSIGPWLYPGKLDSAIA